MDKTKYGLLLLLVLILLLCLNNVSYSRELEKRTLPEYLEIAVEESSREYNLDIALVKAVLFLESRWDVNCISHNYNKKGDIISTDEGLAQINDKLLDFYGSLADLEEPDPFNPIHAIKMCCAGLSFWEEYGIREGYEGEELTLIKINSYNCGFWGYMRYIEKHNTMDRAYSNVVLGFEAMIDEHGYILD